MNDRLVEIRKDRKEKGITGLVHAQPGRTRRQGTHTDARVSIRTATSSDKDGLRAMFSRCSSETVYLRFHMPYPEVPGWMLALMLGVDRDDMEVLVAVADGDIIGHAMYARLGDSSAEMAIVVEDGWQSKGAQPAYRLALYLADHPDSARASNYRGNPVGAQPFVAPQGLDCGTPLAEAACQHHRILYGLASSLA